MLGFVAVRPSEIGGQVAIGRASLAQMRRFCGLISVLALAGCSADEATGGADAAAFSDATQGSADAAPTDAVAADSGGAIDAGTMVDAAAVDAGGGPLGFATHIYPIISRSCASSSCHDGSRPAGELAMQNATTAYNNLVGVATTNAGRRRCVGDGTRVEPGAPDESMFYVKLNPAPPRDCGNVMPAGRGQPLLSTTERDLVRDWITAGAAP